jgi:hypothetical protein
MRAATVSTIGVLVIPTGSMFPHGNDDPDTGSPRCCFHTVLPSALFNAYTVLFSVAMMTRSPTMSGCAYTSPSSRSDRHRWRTPFAAVGPSGDRPLRAASR